jgi:hypothetical protein
MASWPIHKQLEAMCDACKGKESKMNQMLSDIATIKASNPKPQGVADTPVTVVSNASAKRALAAASLLSAAETWVATQNAETQILWQTGDFVIDSPFIAAAATALELDDDDIQDLFDTAASYSS